MDNINSAIGPTPVPKEALKGRLSGKAQANNLIFFLQIIKNKLRTFNNNSCVGITRGCGCLEDKLRRSTLVSCGTAYTASTTTVETGVILTYFEYLF